jgi:hypothetical protein
MRKIALLLIGLSLAAPAFAADNAVIVTPGVGVTIKSKDIGAGVQMTQHLICDASTPAQCVAVNASGQITEVNSAAILSAVNSPIPAGTALIGNVGLNAVTSGGWTPNHLVAAASNNSTNLKASAGIIHAVQGYGVGSAPAYIKLFDKASAPTCGTDVPVKVIMIPAAATAANGAGAVNNIIDVQFSTGIGFCVVTGIANNDNTAVAAATFLVEIDWK